MMELESPFLFGKVHKTYYDKPDSEFDKTNVIEFEVPYVIENMTKYPLAYPIGNHTHKMEVGDSVFITKVSSLNRYFYQPIDFSDFTGIKQSKDNVLELKGDDKFTLITNGNKILDVEKNKLTISVGGMDIFEIDTDLMSIEFKLPLTPPYCNMFSCTNCVVTGAPISSNKAFITPTPPSEE